MKDLKMIQEGNLLIALFMGATKTGYSTSPDKIETVHSIAFEGKDSISSYNFNTLLEYHTSWDWLKPAIDKASTYCIAYPEITAKIRRMNIIVGIEPAWETLVEFIKALNSLSPQTDKK
jgi:hypothetical protein